MFFRFFRRRCSCLAKVFAVLVVCQLLLLYVAKIPLFELPSSLQPEVNFVDALRAHSDADNYVVLAMVDEAFVDMAVNLYEASLRPYDIDNFLFVGVGNDTCRMIREAKVGRALPCFHYADDAKATVASSYGGKDFIRKMNIRTDMILEALAVNRTVVHTDLDMMFFVNPLKEIKGVMRKVDIAALWDNSAFNAGFIVIKPTANSVRVYERVRTMTNDSNGTIDDQRALNRVILSQRRNRTSLRAGALDKRRYECGLSYFEKSSRWFPTSEQGCGARPTFKYCIAVVHNNWIVSKAAKIYRFKEHLMWMYDADGTYYGSETNLYLTYSNPSPLRNASDRSLANKTAQERVAVEELNALKAALAVGQLLNRIVILPRFHCGVDAHACPLNSFLKISSFDVEFAGRYRENSFLQHPKVPTAVKGGVTDPASLPLGKATKRVNGTLVRPTNSDRIVELFGDHQDAVLVFETFQAIVVNFAGEHAGDDTIFDDKIKRGFRRAAYRQF